jgi:CxxC-x17-CxxC domain-containing protein
MQSRNPPARYPFVCIECGAEDTVGFEPREGAELKCRACFNKVRDAARDAEREAIERTPRVKFGTRVAFRAKCSSCGKECELGFAIRDPGSFLCDDCLARTGKKRRDVPGADQAAPTTFVCPLCGREEAVPPRIKEGVTLLCQSCLSGLERSNPERVGGTLIDRKGGVRKKRPGGTSP